MQCPCGQETTTQTHEVKTLDKAIEWYPLVSAFDLPISVEQEKCNACGRMKRVIYTQDDDLQSVMIYQKG